MLNELLHLELFKKNFIIIFVIKLLFKKILDNYLQFISFK